MIKEQRPIIAAIAGILISNKNASSVYSYEISKYINLSGTADKKAVNIYDHDRRCYVSGKAKRESIYALYDYGTRKYVELKIKNNKFDGYDYNTGKYFSGTVSGTSISFYDYEQGKYYNYSI